MNEQLDRIERQLAAIAAHLGIGAKPATGAFRAAAAVATDSDLDGQYGNPEIRFDPRDWKGESMVGRCFSDCPAEYLEMIAEMNDWRAKKDDEKGAAGETNSKGKTKDGHFARLDAARARGWAARARSAPRPKAPPRPAAEDPFGYGAASNERDVPFLSDLSGTARLRVGCAGPTRPKERTNAIHIHDPNHRHQSLGPEARRRDCRRCRVPRAVAHPAPRGVPAPRVGRAAAAPHVGAAVSEELERAAVMTFNGTWPEIVDGLKLSLPWRYFDSTDTCDMFAEVGQLYASVGRTARGRWEAKVSTNMDVRRSHHDERSDAIAAAEREARELGCGLIALHEAELLALRRVWP